MRLANLRQLVENMRMKKAARMSPKLANQNTKLVISVKQKKKLPLIRKSLKLLLPMKRKLMRLKLVMIRLPMRK